MAFIMANDDTLPKPVDRDLVEATERGLSYQLSPLPVETGGGGGGDGESSYAHAG
jgi:hypothetical protein